MDETVLAVTQAALVAIGVGGSVAVLGAARARPRGHRAWIAVIAVIAALMVLAAGAFDAFGVPPAAVEAVQVSWFVIFPLLAATFPDGRFVPRWSIVVVGCSAILLIVDAVLGGAIRDQPWWVIVPVTQTVLCIVWVSWRYRRSATTAEREAVRWVLLGTIATVCCFMLIQVFDGGIGTPDPISLAKAHLAGLPLSAGLVIGSAWPRLWNVDAAFRIAIVVIAAGWLIAGVYAGVASIAGHPAATVCAVGATYPIVRAGLRLADWVVYRGRPDAAEAARRLAAALDAASGPGAVAETITRTAADTVGSAHAELTAASDEDHAVFDARSSRGVESAADVPSDAESWPIGFRGEHLATLRVLPRQGESALSARDRAALSAIVAHAGAALHGARALAWATAAQTRVVTTREEERRRLRRDLHDDLGPTLAGLALAAAALARSAAASDARVADDASELPRDIQQAVAQTREISHGLRPSVLDDRGLVEAVRGRVVEPLHGELEVELLADELGPLPAAIDLAALRIVQEAVANVQRHAGTRRCAVSVVRTDAGLEITVDDDGVGIHSPVRPGVGLRSIRERAAELGGRAVVSARARGGTRVRVLLPIGTGPRHDPRGRCR